MSFIPFQYDADTSFGCLDHFPELSTRVGHLRAGDLALAAEKASLACQSRALTAEPFQAICWGNREHPLSEHFHPEYVNEARRKVVIVHSPEKCRDFESLGE